MAVEVETFNPKSLSLSALEHSWRADSGGVRQIRRHLDHFDIVAHTEFSRTPTHASIVGNIEAASSTALQILDFSVIRENLFDDGNEIASHRIEIGQSIN